MSVGMGYTSAHRPPDVQSRSSSSQTTAKGTCATAVQCVMGTLVAKQRGMDRSCCLATAAAWSLVQASAPLPFQTAFGFCGQLPARATAGRRKTL